MAEKNLNQEQDTEVLTTSVSRVFGSDYEHYKRNLYLSVQLYAARGFLRDDEAKKLETAVEAIFENNDTIVMLPYNTKLTEAGKEMLVGKVTAASVKWVERRIEWTKREIERECERGFPRITKELRQIKMNDFFELDEAINKQEEALERIRLHGAVGVSKEHRQSKESYLSKKSIAQRDALKQAEDALVENLFTLNAFRDEYEKEWYAELASDPIVFMKKVELRRNTDHERYSIESELSAFYRKTEGANSAMKKAIKAQRNLHALHKQMDKVFENLNQARKMLKIEEKTFDSEENLSEQKSGLFKPLQEMFSHRQLQKAETAMKKALNDSKELQKAIDAAQTEYDTAHETWKTIVYGASQKTQTDTTKPLIKNNPETNTESIE